MGQTTFSNDPTVALAGMLADAEHVEVIHAIAAEEIPAGRLVVLNTDGKVELPQDTTLTKVMGVALYQSLKPPGAYAAGDSVPVMRRGKAWVTVSGTAPGDYVAANVRHASDDTNGEATDRGKLCITATSIVAGEEISALSGALLMKGASVSGLAVLELNIP